MGRGVVERFNRTLKEQFESEVRGHDELLMLDELNGYFEAWLAERYHHDVHSETHRAPFALFKETVPPLRPAPGLERLDAMLAAMAAQNKTVNAEAVGQAVIDMEAP